MSEVSLAGQGPGRQPCCPTRSLFSGTEAVPLLHWSMMQLMQNGWEHSRMANSAPCVCMTNLWHFAQTCCRLKQSDKCSSLLISSNGCRHHSVQYCTDLKMIRPSCHVTLQDLYMQACSSITCFCCPQVRAFKLCETLDYLTEFTTGIVTSHLSCAKCITTSHLSPWALLHCLQAGH